FNWIILVIFFSGHQEGGRSPACTPNRMSFRLLGTISTPEFSGRMRGFPLKTLEQLGFRPLHFPKISATDASALTARSTSCVQEHAISSSDRKSTRLNSSHVSISYAVFCLKKKIH